MVKNASRSVGETHRQRERQTSDRVPFNLLQSERPPSEVELPEGLKFRFLLFRPSNPDDEIVVTLFCEGDTSGGRREGSNPTGSFLCRRRRLKPYSHMTSTLREEEGWPKSNDITDRLLDQDKGERV